MKVVASQSSDNRRVFESSPCCRCSNGDADMESFSFLISGISFFSGCKFLWFVGGGISVFDVQTSLIETSSGMQGQTLLWCAWGGPANWRAARAQLVYLNSRTVATLTRFGFCPSTTVNVWLDTGGSTLNKTFRETDFNANYLLVPLKPLFPILSTQAVINLFTRQKHWSLTFIFV